MPEATHASIKIENTDYSPVGTSATGNAVLSAMSSDGTLWRESLQAPRLPFIDELKGVAIVLIVVYHTQLALGWTNWSQGQIGVDIFLLLSGWLIGRSLKPKTAFRDFFWRRIWRIVPAYWAVLGVLTVAKKMTAPAAFDWSNVGAHFLGLQIFGSNEWFFGINSSFWFISLLLVTYPLAYALRGERSPWTILCVGMALGILAYVTGQITGRQAVIVNIPARMISFCAGLALAAALRDNADFRSDRGKFFALAAIGGYLELRGVSMFQPLFYAVALSLAYVLARGGIAAHQPGSTWGPPLAFLGAISYEVYLVHQPMLRLGVNVLPLGNVPWGREISALLGIGGSIAVGWMLNRVLAFLFGRSGKSKIHGPVTAER